VSSPDGTATAKEGVDAAVTDASAIPLRDAGASPADGSATGTDSGTADSGAADSGTLDAGPIADSSAAEADGDVDAAVADSGREDSGALDAGAHHYFDSDGSPLPQWDFIWDQLYAYFGASTPDKITVEHWDGGDSKFSPPDETIVLAPGNDRVDTIAHESTHLCNYALTQGASTMNDFRFFDEGFAEIMGYNIASEGDWYKTLALAVAEQANEAGNVSFDKVQDWATYYGPPSSGGTPNWWAYQVGSSFDYMIQDTRGQAAFHAFLVDIGTTKDLGATFQNVFSSTTSAMEQEWLNYLSQVQIDGSAPAVVEMSPADQATGVSLNTPEISVTFSVAMGDNICVTTPCGSTGVCYTNAYWKAHNVLAIKVDGSLKPGYAYHLVLGGKTCHLSSYVGVPLPQSTWQFTAASQ